MTDSWHLGIVTYTIQVNCVHVCILHSYPKFTVVGRSITNVGFITDILHVTGTMPLMTYNRSHDCFFS
ncbi:hypothetical protein XELAEV_18035804mg [Xenopus laevis]|uniref:Uncharacterized protein n=1 Tax=Xenopus laevis TaxID=8355 RepID=A0A974CGY9_XENLA|nr:hypothetical protein XELAEV_18035804mg [Xenopus laevis]